MRYSVIALALAVAAALPRDAGAQARDSAVSLRHDSVSVHLVDADIRAAVEALAPYLDKPVGFGSAVPGARVTLETPAPVARAAVRGLLEGLLESQNLELVRDSAMYRVQAKAPPPTPSAAVAAETTPHGSGTVQLYVIRLKHARAPDVAATVNALFGRASALGELGSTRPATLDQQLQSTMIAPAGSSAPPQQSTAQTPVSGAIGRSASFTGDVTIVPDARSNSLFIRASQTDYDLIVSAVQQLDTRPLQVLIEVIIAEVERTNSLAFGVEATLPPKKVGQTVLNGSQTGAGLSDVILHAMNLTGLNIDATLTAAAERGDVRILSRPVLVAANNQPATINVGSQRPFVQLARTLPTDNASVDQVVQYKDVGTRLTVLPTISPDGYVGLEVTQEIDNATQEVAFDAPVISTRSIQTELLIKDGQTVALGGFTDTERDVAQGGIPLLSSIPLLGGLFGHASRQTTATEIYLFLTPHVIRSDEDADSVTHPMLDRAAKVKP